MSQVRGRGALGTCPECGSVRALVEFAEEGDVRRALAAALAIDHRLAAPLLEYLGLFAQPGKRLQGRKTVRLLVELEALIGSGTVTRERITYPAPAEYWRSALEQLVQKPPSGLPLTSHGYLEKMVWSESRKVSAKHEREQEERTRFRVQASNQAPQPVAEVVKRGPPPNWKEAVRDRVNRKEQEE